MDNKVKEALKRSLTNWLKKYNVTHSRVGKPGSLRIHRVVLNTIRRLKRGEINRVLGKNTWEKEGEVNLPKRTHIT